MSNLVNKKVILIALSSAILAMTGCSAKSKRSQISISPIAMGGGNMGNSSGYTGGPLVDNTSGVADAADNLQSIVYFEFDSSEISAEAASILQQHASLLGNSSGSRVMVVGHTDARGSREYNMALGERRAKAVKDYLAAQGVNLANVEVVSRGEEEVTGNHDQDRRAVLSY